MKNFLGDLLAHVGESGFEAGEFDFALVNVFEEIVVLIYLCFVFSWCFGEVGETFLEGMSW